MYAVVLAIVLSLTLNSFLVRSALTILLLQHNILGIPEAFSYLLVTLLVTLLVLYSLGYVTRRMV